MAKNKVISIILSFFISGLGNAYNGLFKRFVVEFIIAMLLSVLNTFVSSIFFYICIIWWIYVLYDTMCCTNAINEGQSIPLL